MARRYFGWTTTRFIKGGSRRVNRYRRYGNKTYRIFSHNRYKPSSLGRKKYLENWYDTHDSFGKPRGYRMSDINKFR